MAGETTNRKTRINIDATSSNREGIAGVAETVLRKYRLVSYVGALIPLYLLGIGVMAGAATPGVWFAVTVIEWSRSLAFYPHLFFIAFSIIGGYFIYGFTILFLAPAVNFLLPLRLKPFRGAYYTLESIPWYIHNALTYIVRYTFLEFVTPTPFSVWFYQMMGMKIGKGVHLNTTNISDPCLIEIEDNVTIGGSAHIIAHYASKGFLVVAPVKIRKGATIGLKATIMGDVEIGENAVIGPHEVVLPKSKIPAGRRPNGNIAK